MIWVATLVRRSFPLRPLLPRCRAALSRAARMLDAGYADKPGVCFLGETLQVELVRAAGKFP